VRTALRGCVPAGVCGAGRGNLIERSLLFLNDQHGDFGSLDKITGWDSFAISGR
jgi:hypothetical protein